MEASCSTKELGEAVGVSQRTVDKWIFNNSVPKIDNALKAAKHLNTEVINLFYGLNVETPK